MPASAGCHPQLKALVVAEMFEGAADAGPSPGPSATDDAPLATDTGGAGTTDETVGGFGEIGVELEAEELAQVDGFIWSQLVTDHTRVYLVTLGASDLLVLDVTDGPGDPVEVASLRTDGWIPSFDVTDIAAEIVGERLFIAASNRSADAMLMAGFSIDGVSMLPPRLIVEDASAPTNDMTLVRREDTLHVFYGADGYEKHMLSFNADLSVRHSDTVVPDPANSSQMGCVVPTEWGFQRIAGNYWNHGLVGVAYGPDGEADASDVHDLPIPASEEEWVWFSTGCVQDPQTDDWYVAYQHMWEGEAADDQSSVWLARFDADWTFLGKLRLSDARGYTRPQLLLQDHVLFLSYDRRAEVWAGRILLDPER